MTSARKRMKIIHHQRKQLPSHFSIERLFDDIRGNMPSDCEAACCAAPEASRGIFPRIRNVRHARQCPGDIHHIVGDSHYLAFGLPGKKTVLTIHDCAALKRLSGLRRALLKYFWFVGPMRRAGAVTVISETSKNELRKHVGALADKAEIVPNCVSDAFIPMPKEFDEAEPVCLQIGTKWNKNVERVAEALRGIRCRLEIVGELSPAQRSCIGRHGVPYREFGRVSGHELAGIYQRCDFVVFVSLYEGFGLPVLEAQATGRPLITSNLSSMPEVAGDGALFVDPYSSESIRDAVLRIIHEPGLRAKLVLKGFKNVEKFRPAMIAERYVGIYRRLRAGA